ncbi:MAG TPA: signal peptidase I [Terriglobales bacterium]|nr:signal peptidase I [Terriglobales bacterium]
MIDTVQFLAATVLIAIFVITFLIQAFQIPSESMEKTLLIGDYLLVDKVHYGDGGIWNKILPYEKVKQGDIIVFKWPVRPQQHFVKRVVGAPGDRIRITRGRVFVNGKPIPEKYAIFKASNADTFRDDFPNVRFPSHQVTKAWWDEFPRLVRNGELLIPQDHYFVLGDNRDQSLDSRYWGLVPRENIVGKPFLIYLSLRQNLVDSASIPPDDKIGRFGYVLRHLPAMARWDRTLRLVE